jgi:hypothetical protein
MTLGNLVDSSSGNRGEICKACAVVCLVHVINAQPCCRDCKMSDDAGETVVHHYRRFTTALFANFRAMCAAERKHQLLL